MHPQHYVMTSEMVYRHAANLLQTQLQWVDYGRKCTVKTLLLILFYAAGQLCSLSMACQRLRTAPTDQAVRDALRALCPPLETLEQQFNKSFAAQLPKALRQRRQRLAIDLILIPYHGQPHRRAEDILSRSSQERHHPLSCLCDPLYRAPRAALHRGVNPR